MSPETLSKLLHKVQTDTTLTGTEALQQQFRFLQEWFSDPNHPMLESVKTV